MIEINERWIIDVDESNYMPARTSKGFIDKKSGAMRYPHNAYFTKLSDAITYIIRQDVRAGLSDGTYDLENAVRRIVEVTEEYSGLFKKITGRSFYDEV